MRYKNEWKQRRTIIRYKKDFLSHLTDAQRSLLLGLGLEGEPPPDPKTALGPTFDALVSSASGGSPSGPKIKKRAIERGAAGLAGQLPCAGSGLVNVLDTYDLMMNSASKRQYRGPDGSGGADYGARAAGVMPPQLADYASSHHHHHHQQQQQQPMHHHHHHHHHRLGEAPGGLSRQGDEDSGAAHRADVVRHDDNVADSSMRHVMGAVVLPSSSRAPEETNPQLFMYLSQQQQQPGQSSQAQAGATERDYGASSLVGPRPTTTVSTTGGYGGTVVALQDLSVAPRNQLVPQSTSAGLAGAAVPQDANSVSNLLNVASHLIITGTPAAPLPTVINGRSTVAVAVVGEVLSSTVATAV